MTEFKDSRQDSQIHTISMKITTNKNYIFKFTNFQRDFDHQFFSPAYIYFIKESECCICEKFIADYNQRFYSDAEGEILRKVAVFPGKIS